MDRVVERTIHIKWFTTKNLVIKYVCLKSIFYSINYAFLLISYMEWQSRSLDWRHILPAPISIRQHTCSLQHEYYNEIVVIKCKSLFRSLNPNTRFVPFDVSRNGDLMLLRVARTNETFFVNALAMSFGVYVIFIRIWFYFPSVGCRIENACFQNPHRGETAHTMSFGHCSLSTCQHYIYVIYHCRSDPSVCSRPPAGTIIPQNFKANYESMHVIRQLIMQRRKMLEFNSLCPMGKWRMCVNNGN